jgi:hypothetical protein
VSQIPTPRPVRLAYGINAPQYQHNQQPHKIKYPPITTCPSSSGGCNAAYSVNANPGDRMTRKLVADAEHQRSNRMLYTQTFSIVERGPTQICTPLKGEDGHILCLCEHEEKACQTISAEMLNIRKKKREKSIDEIKDVTSQEQQTDDSVQKEKCRY